MDPTQQPVELYVASHNVSLIGHVVEGRADGASVMLGKPYPSPENLRAGLGLFVAIPSGVMVLQTPARVVDYRHGVVSLQYAGPGKMIQRRKQDRVPCSLGVDYRAIRDGVARGSWKPAVTEDICEGGAALIIQGHVTFPHMVELRIELPSNSNWHDPCRQHGVEEGIFRTGDSHSPIRLIGTARHGKFRQDGTTVVGVKFSTVPLVSRLQLVRFLTGSQGAPLSFP